MQGDNFDEKKRAPAKFPQCTASSHFCPKRVFFEFSVGFLHFLNMFRKPKRNFRSRRAQGDDSDQENGENVAIPGILEEKTVDAEVITIKDDSDLTVPTKKKKKKKDKDKEKPIKKSSSIVSFDHGDEEGWYLTRRSLYLLHSYSPC